MGGLSALAEFPSSKGTRAAHGTRNDRHSYWRIANRDLFFEDSYR